MDNYYVTPDGQLAQLPRRSVLDRLTSGIYDASVEWRKPGGAQEARLGRTQPLTSALNQYGSQKRDFDQQNALLGKRQEFDAGQSILDRAAREKLAADELVARQRLADQRLAQDERQFQATEGRLNLGQNLKGWDTARQFMIEQPRIQAEIEWNKARASSEAAQQELYKARALDVETGNRPTTAAELALLSAVANNPQITSAIQTNPSLTNMPVSTLGTILRARPGMSGTDPELIKRWFGPDAGTSSPAPSGTNAPPVIDLKQLQLKK